MGSGKTYEVVSVVILGALSRGRRVVSNIAGLDFEAMKRIIVADGVDAKCVGELVQVQHDDVLEPMFWRTDENFKESGVKRSGAAGRLVVESTGADADGRVDAFLQPGDLLVLDEVWRFWDGFMPSRGMSPRVMNFFRMHRHFVQPETGFTCDVALITQDVMDISRSIRSVVEETYLMTKLTAIGSSTRYRIDIFSGSRISGRVPFRSLQRQYESKFFPLYSSHSQKDDDGVAAKEENIDDRGNIFKSKFFRVVLPLCVVVLIYSIYNVVSFFSVKEKSEKGGKSDVVSVGTTTASVVSAPSARSKGDNALVAKDVISVLFAVSDYRLSYIYNDGKRLNVKITFIKSTGEVYTFSEDVLYLHGWRLFFAPDNNSLVATNGVNSYVVFQDGLVKRYNRFSQGEVVGVRE
jgi:zona occludens toxin